MTSRDITHGRPVAFHLAEMNPPSAAERRFMGGIGFALLVVAVAFAAGVLW